MKYLVTGSIIVNNIKYLDGTMQNKILGGCATYAYTGVRMLTDECRIAGLVGDDFDEYFGEWYKENNISKECLTSVCPHTLNTLLEYHEDGSFWDHSIWGGPNVYHDDSLKDIASGYTKFLPQVETAVYLFNNAFAAAEAKKKYGFKVMVEGKCNGDEAYKDELLSTMDCLDIFSINKNECRDIFGTKTEEEAINLLLGFEKPCYFRLGTKGSVMIADGKTYFAPIVRISKDEKDPTGCGNSSTAAAMWAWFEGYDPLMTTCISNVVSGYNALQVGPIPKFTEEIRKDILKRAEDLYFELK